MTAEDGHFLSAEQLRPGVFVILDLPWFKHNFTLNSFKIRSADQVQELRELKLARYRYDPAKSDGLDVSVPPAQAAAALPEAPPPAAPVIESATATPPPAAPVVEATPRTSSERTSDSDRPNEPPSPAAGAGESAPSGPPSPDPGAAARSAALALRSQDPHVQSWRTIKRFVRRMTDVDLIAFTSSVPMFRGFLSMLRALTPYYKGPSMSLDELAAAGAGP